MSLSAPYVVTNIIFNKGERFNFGSKKQHAVNNMLYFEAAVKQEMRSNGFTKEENNQPHKWDYDKMEQRAKAAAIRRKMPRGMTAHQDPVVAKKLAALTTILKNESSRRAATAPHYNEFLRLFDQVNAGSVHDEYPPIPLSSTAQARRDAIERRRRAREQRPSIRAMTSPPRNRKDPKQAAAQSRLRGPRMTAIQAQIMRAKRKGLPVQPPGIMSQTASRGLT